MACTEVHSESQNSLSITSLCQGTLPDGERRTGMCLCWCDMEGQFAGLDAPQNSDSVDRAGQLLALHQPAGPWDFHCAVWQSHLTCVLARMPDILIAPGSICRVADGALLLPLSHLWYVPFFRWHFQISFVPSVLLKVRKTFTYEFSSVLVLGPPIQASAVRFLLVSSLLRKGCYKTFIQVMFLFPMATALGLFLWCSAWRQEGISCILLFWWWFSKVYLGDEYRTVRARSSLEKFGDWEEWVWTLEQSWVYIICSKPEVQQMWCRDLSIVVVSEIGVPAGFSINLEVGQGRVHFQILCQRLVLWHGLCCSPLLQCSHSLAGSCRAFLGYQVGDSPHFTLSYKTRSHLEVGIH